MSDVIFSKPADSPGYTHVVVAEPIGTTQASATVVAKTGDIEQTLHLCGQREFDVLDGAEVTFPDGTVWKPASAKK